MHQGIIFDIKEFSVHDGPGVRQTVFFKGCPLRCNWCHNPEGWVSTPQLFIRQKDCIRCGICSTGCTHISCIACGHCIPRCPVRARWISGEVITSDALVQRILKLAPDYAAMDGGVTFSGGEPLMQPEFLFEVTASLKGIHKVLETCGHAPASVFRQAMDTFDLIYMDFKIADPALHQEYTGLPNDLILQNIRTLCEGTTPFVIRIPLIPGITDTEDNLTRIAACISDAKALQYVELLPYNRMAGSKYAAIGQEYHPRFRENQSVALRHDIFARFGIESRGS